MAVMNSGPGSSVPPLLARAIAILAVVVLAGWYLAWLAVPIHLTSGDLGQHLKTGQLLREAFASGDRATRDGLLETNFYAQTHAPFPAPNHRWGSGVVFSMIHDRWGFTGLSVVSLAGMLAALLLAFDTARRLSGFTTAFVVAVFLVPLLADRREVRPELFGYLFLALFAWVLDRRDRGEISSRSLLLLLPATMILWINLHISFVFGLALLGFSVLEEAMRRVGRIRDGIPERFRESLVLLAATFAAAFVNPLGVRLVAYPFAIFVNYGMPIVENTPILALERMGYFNPAFPIFKVAVALGVAAVAVRLFRRQPLPLRWTAMAAMLTLFAATAARHVVLFGIVALPALAALVSDGSSLRRRSAGRALLQGALLVAWVGFLVSRRDYIPVRLERAGVGLVPGNSAAAEFFVRNRLRGPILNTFGIGGYVIFHLFPQERPFVDSRSEAYPAEFLSDEYPDLMESTRLFRVATDRYRFDAILLDTRDSSVSGRKFFVDRMTDPEWAPVWIDERVVIFLRRCEANREAIRRLEIAPGRFVRAGPPPRAP